MTSNYFVLRLNNFIFFSLLLIFISCEKEKIKNTIVKELPIQEKSDEEITSKQTKIRLNRIAKQTVENWDEYQNIAVFIPKYYKTTTKEALFNSQRLAELAQQLKDTIRVTKFDLPSFRIRLNVLHNEAVRLADMDSISNITTKEIITENKNIVNAFEAIKAKINSMVKKEKLDQDLEEFDHLFEINDSLDKQEEKRELTRKRIKKRIAPLVKKEKNE